MNDIQKQILLKVAKDAVVAAVKNAPAPHVESDDDELNLPCGCFVTLKNKGSLRGCIGQFISEVPLIQMVAKMGLSAATGDPRFLNDPITVGELDEIDIEISVLSRLVRTDEPLGLRLGIDGVYIKKGPSTGCFLPQVATETGWSKEQFLSYCCAHKAGLAPDAWKQPGTEIYFFTAEILENN